MRRLIHVIAQALSARGDTYIYVVLGISNAVGLMESTERRDADGAGRFEGSIQAACVGMSIG